MKKAFLTISILFILVFSVSSVSALENTMTNTSMRLSATGYTFECVITPTVTATCKPVIAMFDSDGALCGHVYGDDISVTAGTRIVKTFVASTTSTPSEIKVMLWSTDGSYAPVSKFEQVSVAPCTEKFGMITELTSSGEIRIFATDGSHDEYSLADNVILSHKSDVITDKTSAKNYIETLKLSYYTNSGVNRLAWNLFLNDYTCYKDNTGSAGSLYTYPDYLDNYTKRMIRFLTTDENKIISIAFEDDKLFKNLTSTKTLNAAFYTLSSYSFNDAYNLTTNAKVLYIPTKSDSSTSDYAVIAPSQVKNGNYYHLKMYSANGNQIVLLTYMYTDAELATFNKKKLQHISTALNGDGKTIKGINNYSFNISLTNQSSENNDFACDVADLAMKYVANGLQGALDAAGEGYAITPELVKIKFKDDIQKARTQLNIIRQLDEDLSSNYYGEFENTIPKAIGNLAMNFLKEYFLSN